jgi:tripartite-type tricarboxylate transporter receptor subunit TctC
MARLAALLAGLCAVAIAFAQAYPSKPIRLMIGYTAGGSAEAGARPLARALEPNLGQPLVFEYRPGNAGGVAMEVIAKANMDLINATGCDAQILPAAQTAEKVKADHAKWGKVVRDANIRVE